MCNFRDPNLIAFYFYELTHFLDWMKNTFSFHLQYKHSGTIANRKYGELSYPQKSENVRSHYSQSSRENATPSRGTSPLAFYKEVLPLPSPSSSKQQMQKEPCRVRTSLKGWN